MNAQVISFITTLFDLIFYTILIRIILSWFPSTHGTAIFNYIYQITESIMYPVRYLLNKLGLDRGFMDWAPLLTMLLLRAIEQAILQGIIR